VLDTYFKVERSLSTTTLETNGSKGYSTGTIPLGWRSLRVNVSSTILEDLDMANNLRNDTKVIGTECAMLRCIQSIDAAVHDGLYQEQITDTFYFEDRSDGNKMATLPWGEEKGVRFDETFGMTPEAYESAEVSFVDFTGSGIAADGGRGIAFDSEELRAIFSATFTQETCATPQDNFACVFNAMGSAM
jgi:hypothetical protein